MTPANPLAGDANAVAPTALVIEDDAMIASVLHFILDREGFTVRHAVDGQAAQLLIAASEPPALVLLDVMLPHADGFELVAAIRARAGWEKTPVLMLSSKGHEQDIARALDAGADDYVVKPFQIEELRARLRRLRREKT
ncbi:MAG: response regulator [Rhodocyclales bacterium]|nr:response regulator [Rhodocyclales bacterium]